MSNTSKQNSELKLHARPTVFGAELFRDQVVLITGGTGGIGRAVAWLFARLGARVIITSRTKNKADHAVQELIAAGHHAEAHILDIRNDDDVTRLYRDIWKHHERLDHVVQCAGGQFPLPAIDISEKGWKSVVDTNLNGTWFVMQEAARLWKTHGKQGTITSIVVVTGRSLYGIAHSRAARAGVIDLTRSAAVEWAEHGLRVNCVAPGLIETTGWNVYDPHVRNEFSQGGNPMMRCGDPWDIAEACVYLASPAANFISGHTLVIDGGGESWGEVWTIPKPAHLKT